MKKILLLPFVFLALLWSTTANAQCSGVGAANAVCSSPNGSSGFPSLRALVMPDLPSGLASGTSGGIPFWSSATTLGTSALLTANGIVIGGGAGVAPNTSTNFSFPSANVLTAGVNGTIGGVIDFTNGGGSGQSVRIQNLSTTTGWNFNLPISAGSAGQPLISQGGVAAAQTYGTLGIFGGGTNCAAASGTCLDNITGFATTGYVNRTGAGTYTTQAAASTTQWENNTSSLVMTTDQIWAAGAFPTITFGTTTTIDLSTLINGTVTLTGNITTLNWSNCKAGQTGVIEFIQDGTGTRTVPAAWNSSFRWAGGIRGVLSTAINSIDWLFYQCKSASVAFVSLQKGLSN